MYLQSTVTEQHLMQGDGFFQPKWPEEQIKQAAKLEIWCTNFNDPGPDSTTFKLINADGKIIATQNIGGY